MQGSDKDSAIRSDTSEQFYSGDPDQIARVASWARDIIAIRFRHIPEQDSKDIVQEVLTMVLTASAPESVARPRNLRAFTRHVATARAIDWLRLRKPSVGIDENGHVHPGSGPYDDVLRRDETERLRYALTHIDSKCRSVLQAHYLDGVSYAVLAAEEGLAESTLRVRSFDCLRKLRAFMKAME